MILKKSEINDLIAGASTSVRILGVVPLEPDWDQIVKSWSTRGLREGFSLSILCESDNMLFAKAFTTDTDKVVERRNFRDLKIIRDEVSSPKNLSKDLRENQLKLNQLIEITHLPIPISVVEIDGKCYINLWLNELNDQYQEITIEDPWHSFIQRYTQSYFDPALGRKYSAPSGDELLELFDHDRIPRGIFPRQSFYDTDYSQLVVWALIFDRRGKLLLHRRSDNAKDNRGMWDKSVGGHLDIKDLDTARAAVREVIEELYQDEIEEGSEIHRWVVTDKDIINFGDWRPENRGKEPFREIGQINKEWSYFRLRLPEGFQLYSPRTLPGDKTRRLRVIPDVFVFVAGNDLTEESIQRFKNSRFKLMALADLKTAMDRAIRNEEVPGFDEKLPIPKFTPDLVNIMTGQIRDILEEFSQYIKRYLPKQA